jgi:hypothetical protein
MENLTQDEIADRIEMLEQADWNLRTAIKQIADALQGTEHESHANAYIIAHLTTWLDGGRFDMGIAQYQEALQNTNNDDN